MARFPIRESEIIALAHQIIAGFTAHPDIYANPPVPPDQLQQELTDFLGDCDSANQADAQSASAHIKKDGSGGTLKDSMTLSLRYAENTVTSPEQLGLIGWSGPRAASTLQIPGQPRVLEVVRQGPGWVFLDWKDPADGGKPAAYHIQYRELPDGDWKPAGIAVISEATVTGLPTGKTLELRVQAVNKVGDGPVSNVVDVVL